MIDRYVCRDGGLDFSENGSVVFYEDHLAEVAALRDKLEKCERDAARFNILLENCNTSFDENEIIQLIARSDVYGNIRSDEYIKNMLDHLIQQSKDSAQGEK